MNTHTAHPRHARTLAAGLMLCLATLASGTVWSRDTAPGASARLETLNQNFRTHYKERTREVVASLPLVLVVQNSTITAVRGNQHRLYPVPLQRYNEARAIMHAALGFHGVMLALEKDTSAPAAWQNVESFLQDVDAARRALPASTLSKAEKADAAQVLDTLQHEARKVLAQRSVSREAISATLQHLEPLLTRFSLSVGRAHAGNMLDVLDTVRADSTPEEWENAVAVVTGPMTARRGNLETAVVAAALGKEQLGKRIFYSENIFSVEGALGYLQTVMGDQELSQNVFGSGHRMWEDLFSPVSRELVDDTFYAELGR